LARDEAYYPLSAIRRRLPAVLSPAEAERAILAHAPRLPEITAPIEALTGAILREPIVASRDQPPFDRVTMDGVAFLAAEWRRGRRTFRIAGVQPAGAAPLALTDPTACIEVMTGASLPQGCDCVVPVEKISVRDGAATLADDVAPTPGLNVHARGFDVRRGAHLLEAGVRIGPAEIAVIASNGLTQARVSRPPRIVVISTGDEVVEPGTPAADWQIYRSNAYAVANALNQWGFAPEGHEHLPDDPSTLRSRLRAHLDANDVLVLSGGVSMGRFDYVPQILAELGVSVVFHNVAQRPGKPMWFGVGPAGQAVYALPGNPVSTLVCLARYVRIGLNAALGAPQARPEIVSLSETFEVKPALTCFVPVALMEAGERRIAEPRPTRGSGDFTSLVGTDGFVELPPGPRTMEKGTNVPFYRW
jgi:molybdopterin molybdotransferase